MLFFCVLFRLTTYLTIDNFGAHGRENWSPKSRYYLKDNADLEIPDQYNGEIRGFRNYYRIANNSAHAGSFGYIMQYSFFQNACDQIPFFCQM